MEYVYNRIPRGTNSNINETDYVTVDLICRSKQYKKIICFSSIYFCVRYTLTLFLYITLNVCDIQGFIILIVQMFYQVTQYD